MELVQIWSEPYLPARRQTGPERLKRTPDGTGLLGDIHPLCPHDHGPGGARMNRDLEGDVDFRPIPG